MEKMISFSDCKYPPNISFYVGRSNKRSGKIVALRSKFHDFDLRKIKSPSGIRNISEIEGAHFLKNLLKYFHNFANIKRTELHQNIR